MPATLQSSPIDQMSLREASVSQPDLGVSMRKTGTETTWGASAETETGLVLAIRQRLDQANEQLKLKEQESAKLEQKKMQEIFELKQEIANLNQQIQQLKNEMQQIDRVPCLECRGRANPSKPCSFCKGRGFNSDHFLKGLQGEFQTFVT